VNDKPDDHPGLSSFKILRRAREGLHVRSIGFRKASVVVIAALAFAGAGASGSSAADDTFVQFDARVSWIAAQTMVVSTDGASAVSIDLSRVPQDEYQRLVTGDRVIVSGTLEGNRVVGTSIESLE